MNERCSRFIRVLAASIALLGCELGDVDPQQELELRVDGMDDTGLPVEITPTDSILLQWDVVTGASYSVYRSTNPSFTITGPDATLIASGLTVGELEDDFPLDPFDPVDPDDPYDIGVFYRVVEHTSEGHATSAAHGMVPIAVRHTFVGNPAQYSKIPVCLVPSPAEALRELVLSKQPVSIHRWDPATQSTASDVHPYESVLGFEPGTAFAVRSPARTVSEVEGPLDRYSLTGRVPEVCELVTPLYEGLNSLTWPATSGVTTASALSSSIPGATAVGQWVLVDPPMSVTQGLRWYPDVPPQPFPNVDNQHASEDFDIHPCSVVDVYIDSSDDPDGTPLSVTWPPGTLACGS